MNKKTVRIAAMTVAVAILLATGVLGLKDAFFEWADVQTTLQRTVAFGGGVYGVLGLIAGGGVLLRRRWGIPFAMAWATVTTMVGTLAAGAYAPEESSLGSGAGAFAACVVITGAVVWLARFGINRSS